MNIALEKWVIHFKEIIWHQYKRIAKRLFEDSTLKEHISKKLYIYPDHSKLSQLENETTIPLIISFHYWNKVLFDVPELILLTISSNDFFQKMKGI